MEVKKNIIQKCFVFYYGCIHYHNYDKVICRNPDIQQEWQIQLLTVTETGKVLQLSVLSEY